MAVAPREGTGLAGQQDASQRKVDAVAAKSPAPGTFNHDRGLAMPQVIQATTRAKSPAHALPAWVGRPSAALNMAHGRSTALSRCPARLG